MKDFESYRGLLNETIIVTDEELAFSRTESNGETSLEISRKEINGISVSAVFVSVELNKIRFASSAPPRDANGAETVTVSQTLGHLVAPAQAFRIFGAGNVERFRVCNAEAGVVAQIQVTYFG